MKIQLSDHFDYRRLLKFVFPSIIMMIFTSIYGVVDGLFVSNFVGKVPFAAINLIIPVLMIIGTLGFMIGTGGSAIVSMTLGEGKEKKANEYFSMLVYVAAAGGILLSVLGYIGLRPISIALGATEDMLGDCILYGRIILAAMMPFILQNVFQSFFVTAGRPGLGLAVTVAAGLTNMVLDFVFIVLWDLGIAGAAIATSMSQVVGGVLPLFYFAGKNNSLLRLTRTRFYLKILVKTCTNGASELMTNISMSLVTILYNFQLMNIAGEDGVAAYGVIMYVNFIFIAIFLGYSIGSAPVIGYHYGAGDKAELKNLLQKSLMILSVFGLLLTAAAEGLAVPLTKVFVGYDKELMDMTCRGFRFYAVSFLFSGFPIFGSAFFTALGNGGISAAISFLRTLVFQTAAVLFLPVFLKVDGIWLAIIVAELMAMVVTGAFLLKERRRYGYGI